MTQMALFSLLSVYTVTKNFLLVLVWILLVVTTLTVVLVKHPVHCILSLVLVFIEAGFLLLILNLDYLAFVFLVVYVGAIAVLFLFVTMMLNIRTLQINISTIAYLPATIFLLFAVFFQLFYIINTSIYEIFHDIRFTTSVWFPDGDGCPLPDDAGPVNPLGCLSTTTTLEAIEARSLKRGFLVHLVNSGILTKSELMECAHEMMFASFTNSRSGLFNYTIHFPRSLITSQRPFYNDFIRYFYSMPAIYSFAHCFYTFFYSSIFAAALVLLVAMIGSISLTLYHRADVRRQASYQQILREHFATLKNSNYAIKSPITSPELNN